MPSALDPATGRPRMKFDPTVNFGHILTFATMLSVGIGVYTSLDKRVLILEEARSSAIARESASQARLSEKFEAIKESQRDTQQAIESLRRDIRDSTRDREARRLP